MRRRAWMRGLVGAGLTIFNVVTMLPAPGRTDPAPGAPEVRFEIEFRRLGLSGQETDREYREFKAEVLAADTVPARRFGTRVAWDRRVLTWDDDSRVLRVKSQLERLAVEYPDLAYSMIRRSRQFETPAVREARDHARPAGARSREYVPKDALRHLTRVIDAFATTPYRDYLRDPQAVNHRESVTVRSLRILDDFDFAAVDAWMSPPEWETLRSALRTATADRAATVLGHRGLRLVMAEQHQDPAAKLWMRENMAALVEAGLRTVYLEGFTPAEQPDVDSYLASGVMPAPLAAKVERIERHMADLGGSRRTYLDLFRAARDNSVRVVGIDSQDIAESAHDVDKWEARWRNLNTYASETIRRDQSTHPGGYLALVGELHAHTFAIMDHASSVSTLDPRPGDTQWKGFPGLAELLLAVAVVPDAASPSGIRLCEEHRTRRGPAG